MYTDDSQVRVQVTSVPFIKSGQNERWETAISIIRNTLTKVTIKTSSGNVSCPGDNYYTGCPQVEII